LAAAAAAAAEPVGISNNLRIIIMAKIPDRPQDIFVDLTNDYIKVFDKELVSLILYGSAAAGSYIKGKSDINLLVVLTAVGINRLADVLDTVKYWKKRHVAVPLMLTKQFIESSLDSYPIEFLNMKNNHVLIYGENILDQLNFNPADLRLQIERELKGKLILLRQGYLEEKGKTRQLKMLISKSLTAFISIFNALLYLKQGTAPKDRRATINELAKVLGVDAEVFLQCADLREGKSNLSGEDVISLFTKYIQEVEKICNIVDAL
jgi:predicted nucleotidyltransferase